jgi:hypothetical protein
MSHQPVQLLIHQIVQPVTITDIQSYPLTWITYQGHLSTRFPTSPTHASTKHVPNHQPISQHMHQPCTNTCTTTCMCQSCTISCITHASNMYHVTYTIYHTMCQPCASIMYINTIPCTNHIPYHAIHHIPIRQDMNQQCISQSKPQPTCTMYPMMCLKS